MKVPHEIIGRTRPSGQGLGYLQASSADLSGIAQGLANLGQGIDLHLKQAKLRDDQTDRFSSLKNFSDFETRMDTEITELKRNADPTGKGFAKQADEYYRRAEQKFLATEVTPELTDEFRYRSAETRGKIFGNALDFQYKQGDAFYRTSVDSEYQKALKSIDPKVGGDPANLEAAKKKLAEVIDATDLPDATGSDQSGGKAELKRMTTIGLEAAGYKQAYKINRQGGSINLSDSVGQVIDEAADRYDVPRQYARTIAWIESKGDPQAQNPGSSAAGLFQQIDSNAEQYGLKNKFNAAENADAGVRFIKDNINGLKKVLGREPSIGEVYLAHQQGLEGAVALLKNPNALATSIVGADAVRLNGGAPGMTAGQFANLWIKRADKANPDLDNNPAYANVPYEDRLAMRKDADAEINREDTEAANQLKFRIANQQNDLMNGIQDGTRGQMDIDAGYQEGWGADYDFRKKAQDLLDKKLADDMTVAKFSNMLGQEHPVFDPTDTKTKDAYNLWAKKNGIMDGLDASDQATVTDKLLPVVGKTSDIPTDVMGHLQGLMRSSNPQQVMFAMDTLRQLQDADGRAFADRAPDDVERDLNFYRARRGTIPDDQFVEMLNGGHTQEERQRRRELYEQAQANLKKENSGIPTLETKVSEVVGTFGSFFGGARLVSNPAFARELNGDFQTFYSDGFVMLGDDKLATEFAQKQIQKYWGVTNIGGAPTLMKYPPEKVGYRPMGGDYSYIDKNLRMEMGLQETDKFQLISDEQTETEFGAWKAGKGPPASYMVIVQSGEDSSYSFRMTPNGLPDRRSLEPSAADVQKETDYRVFQRSAADLQNAQDILSQALTLEQTQGVPVPEELVENVRRLQGETEQKTPPSVPLGTRMNQIPSSRGGVR